MTNLNPMLEQRFAPRPLSPDLARALRWRLSLVAQLFTGRSPARTALWLLGGLTKGLIAVGTLGFIYFTVELPSGVVMAMFLVPPALALLAAGIRGTCQRRSAQHRRIEQQKRLEADQARALAEARLALLQAQADPDFLFNTLAALQHLMRKDARGAAVMLDNLVQYLRLSANSFRCDNSTLGAQMDLVDAYLQLAAIRMGKRLFVQVACPPELKGVPFPPIVIHALAENALLHGAEPAMTPVMIRVSAHSMGGRLLVDVQDDGVGLDASPTRSQGRGLANVRTRLHKAFGEAAHLSVCNQPTRGVLSRIEIENQDSDDRTHNDRRARPAPSETLNS